MHVDDDHDNNASNNKLQLDYYLYDKDDQLIVLMVKKKVHSWHDRKLCMLVQRIF